ncbi:MAG TPA: hypothetical protein VHW65_01275 [Gemmatimonadales bacterium]|jgi:hypothetical protein|nr:hypothetical protein [Gemmatimonadales bacterium]
MMRPVAVVLLSLGLATSLTAQQRPVSGATASKMTPTARAQAQANLQAQAAMIYSGTISSSKQELRGDVVPLRDTLQTVAGTAARVLRANTAKNGTVVTSSSRILHAQCVGVNAVATATLAKLTPMRTSAAAGDKILDRYRGAVSDIVTATAACIPATANSLSDKPPPNAAVVKSSEALTTAAENHDRAFDALTTGLGIPVLPKGYVPPVAH